MFFSEEELSEKEVEGLFRNCIDRECKSTGIQVRGGGSYGMRYHKCLICEKEWQQPLYKDVKNGTPFTQKLRIGKYRCGLCGQLKRNHVCAKLPLPSFQDSCIEPDLPELPNGKPFFLSLETPIQQGDHQVSSDRDDSSMTTECVVHTPSNVVLSPKCSCSLHVQYYGQMRCSLCDYLGCSSICMRCDQSLPDTRIRCTSCRMNCHVRCISAATSLCMTCSDEFV